MRWIDTFLMVSTSHAKFAHIELRAGRRCENVVFLCFYRQDAAKRQSPGIKFTHTSKISIFAPQEGLVAPIHEKFGTAEDQVGTLGRAKFHASRCPKMGTGPQNGKNFYFLVKSPPFTNL